jgi:predicted ATP-grasp superfamily ATP-dependent carboligase
MRRGGKRGRFGERLEPVVLLGGGRRIAVSAARSLGENGVTVYALGVTHTAVRYSRFCDHFIDLGSETEEATQAWLAWLLQEGPHGAVILPCNDEGLEMVARNRPRLVELGYHPMEANDEAILAMLDKERTSALARELGVPAPLTLEVKSVADAERAAQEMNFPCLLKPVHSHLFTRHYGQRRKLFVSRTQEELREQAADALEAGLEMLAMETIPGGDEQIVTYWTYLEEGGEPLCHFTKRRIRQYPVRFGVGSYHITQWDPEVAELGLKFLRGAGARGLAAVEFKRDTRDGIPKLMECNHRLTGSIELGRAAGMDFSLLAYRRALKLPTPSLDGFREGVRLWIPGLDLRAFLDYRREGGLTTAQWLRSIMHRQRFPVFQLSDPKPALITFARRVQRAVARRLWERH